MPSATTIGEPERSIQQIHIGAEGVRNGLLVLAAGSVRRCLRNADDLAKGSQVDQSSGNIVHHRIDQLYL